MALLLHYRVNEGVKLTENKKSIDMIVRKIKNGNAENHDISIILEFLEGNLSSVVELFQRGRYNHIEGMECDLSFPIQYPRRVDRVLIELFASRKVEISQRAIYSIQPHNL